MLKRTMQMAALAASGALLAPGFAHAALITTTPDVAFKVNASISDTLGANKTASNGSASGNDLLMGTTKLAQFDSSKGVLTGVEVKLNSTYKHSTSVTVPGTNAGNNSGNASASGTGSSAVRIVMPNGSAVANANRSATDTCGAKPKDACNNGATSSQVSHNLTVGSSNLGSYVGAGTVDVRHEASSLVADTTSNTFNSGATTMSTADWEGTLAASYSYLLHAEQSFDQWGSKVMNLNFGSVYQGDSVADLVFFFHNLAGDRVGMNLTGITETGDPDNKFTTNVANVGTLAAGASTSYAASFLTDTVGSFGAIYEFVFADAAPDGAFATSTLGSGYKLTLNLTGSVVERPGDTAEVPEPGSLMLLGLGAAAFGLRRKRRT